MNNTFNTGRLIKWSSWVMSVCGLAICAPTMAGVGAGLNFENVTATRIAQTVAESSGNEKQVELGDFDRDGDLDVVVGAALGDFNGRRNKLYRNDNGVFNEISGSPVISGFSNADVSRAIFFRDFDGDGWVDIYLVNDSNSDADIYYRNNHPGNVFASFIDETAARVPSGGNLGASCSGVAEDFNGDGFIDVYAGNYPFDSQDRMIFNDGLGVFSQVTNTHVPADSDYTVDIASGDMNGDGRLDLLIGNEHDPLYIYYNNNQNAGSGLGDFRYSGSAQQLAPDNSGETVLEPIDVDGDGDLDIYRTNASGTGDRIMRNNGNNASNQAQFTTLNVLPVGVTGRDSRKVTVTDFDNDGRDDVLVMFESGSNGRPVILRNVTEGDDIRFLDWTPGDTFPDGSTHRGWHAQTLDVNADERQDIFLGGFNNDHFFDNTASNVVDAAGLGGILPAVYNTDPVLVFGNIPEPGSNFQIPFELEVLARGATVLSSPSAQRVETLQGGSQISFQMNDVPANGMVSILARSCGDIAVSVTDDSAAGIASSDRGGVLVEEPISLTAPGGVMTITLGLIDGGLCGDTLYADGFE